MLYCLLVVPKELYKLAKDDPFYKSLKARDAMDCFSFKKQRRSFYEDPLYHLKSLRNAVSHVNFRIDTSNTLVFWDHPPGRPSEKHWEVSVAQNDLIQFLSVIADEYHKLYNQIQTGQRQWTNST